MAETIRDPEIIDIQKQCFVDFAGYKKWIVIELPDGYELHIHTNDSVHPVIKYPNKRAVVARLLQLFDIGPVAPQTHAERVEIGAVDVVL